MDIDNVFQRYLAHRNINFNLGKCAAEGVGVVADGVGALGGNMFAVHGIILRSHCQFRKRHQNGTVAFPDNIAVDDIHVCDCLPGDFVGIV